MAATPPELRGQTMIEITENSVIDDFDRMREVVRQLRAHGFRIAIDDAGAGYSGLQTMVEIEPDFIKLDMSLIRGIESSMVKQKLVRTLRDFCREAGIELIAEGIETRDSSMPCSGSASRTARASCSATPAPLPAARGLSAARGRHAQGAGDRAGTPG